MTVDFSGQQHEKLFHTTATFTGNQLYILPLEYEKVDEIIESIYQLMKRTNVRKQEITIGRDNRQNVNKSICRIYVDIDGTWSSVYWPRKNETLPYGNIAQTRKTIKELVLYALKFERDPAE